MRLGIDLDGVVADFNAGWMDRYNAERGTELHPGLITSWGSMIPLTDFANMDEFWTWARNDGGRGLFASLEPYPDAIETVTRLSADHDIVVVTTKPHWAYPETFAWLVEHGFPADEVHITESKWWVDCDAYLDDGPHNLEALIREHPDRITCRFVRPWNRPLPGVTDIPDWSTFEDLVQRRWC